ncbi:MAG: hypothetical protein MJY98_03475 [Fibrobacter sp.]|nr:hypothetical protein [Fibrobacter sp.]
MANNNISKNNEKMNNKQVYPWTAAQESWLTLAKRGNEIACGKLFNSMKNLLESVHRFSQDGLYPAKFGYDYNYSGRSFEEAYSDIYTAFRNAVRRFDASQGVPFGAYAVNDLRHRAMDWTRDRQNDHHVMVGQRLADSEDGEVRLLTQADYENAVNRSYEEKSLAIDSETHPVEYCEMVDMVAKIRRELVEKGDKKLLEFVGLYLEYAGEKKVMDLVAEKMQVSRAMAYNYLGRLRNLVMPKFGQDLGIAA